MSQKKPAKDAEQPSKENQTTAPDAAENSTGNSEQQLTPDQRIARLETVVNQMIGYLDQMAARLNQPQNPQTTTYTQPQQNRPPVTMQDLTAFMKMAEGEEKEDTFITAMKQKALAGMDLQNQLTTTLINLIAKKGLTWSDTA